VREKKGKKKNEITEEQRKHMMEKMSSSGPGKEINVEEYRRKKKK
jgi:hypothetical protein